MKQLALMRHLHAQLKELHPIDRNRPMSMQGMYESESLKKKIKNSLSHIDLILCSNCKRGRQSLDALKNMISSSCTTEFVDRLYEASVDTMLSVIKEMPESKNSIFIIGHNPGIHNLFHTIVSLSPFDGYSHRFIYPTGGISFYEVHSLKWSKIRLKNIKYQSLITPSLDETVYFSGH